MRKTFKIAIAVVPALALLVYANNRSGVSSGQDRPPSVLVHRGMAQRYSLTDLTPDTCTAAQMVSTKHEFLENTIASMQAAFDHGADVVEFDVQRIRDNRFAVFHDRRLDCRTNGRGLTRERTLEELKTLDIGYGYTADGGKTYPFRGKGVGLMPTMEEVFHTFPGRSFLIDIKGADPQDGALLAGHLSRLSAEWRKRLIVFGRESVLAGFRERLPDLQTFSVQSIQNCLVRYIAYGWTGNVPAACENATLFVPINVAPWLWGWPYSFIERMKSNGSSIVLMGPLGGNDFPAGVDTAEQLSRVPAEYDGGIWTNDVAFVVSAVKKSP